LDAPEADPAGQTAQRSRNPALEGCALASAAPILRTNEQILSSFLGTFSTHTTSIFDSWRAPFQSSYFSYHPQIAPLLLDKYTYKHLSLVGAAAPQGKLFLTVYALLITSQEVVLLLGQLLRIIAGLLLVIGTVFRRIAPGSSMPTWQMELPGASTWSNCQAVPLTSTRPIGFRAI
jgi:hypothetical protein